jgi:DeoR/GlpR family transcriptional regulator of sugar metabolism
MSSLKRHESIMALLLQNGEVKVSELSELLQVTGKTVREDLEKLEHQGLLVRIHGGAVLKNDADRGLLPSHEPNAKQLAEKADAAAKAVSLIEPNDIIALDVGSTTLEIAKLLDNAPLTVITNDLFIISELARKDRIHLVVPGGYRQRNMLISSDAIGFIRKLNIQKAFLTTSGIHSDFGFTIYTSELQEQKRALMACAKETICVADHTKFDKYALMTFAELSEVHSIITDSGLSDDVAEKYRSYGLSIEK